MRDEQPDVIEVNVLEPTVRVTVDCRSAGAVGNYVGDRDVSDFAGRRFVVALSAVDLAAALDIEVNRVAVAPPEPIEPARFDRDIGNHNVFDYAAVEDHKGQAAIRIGDNDIVDGDATDGVGIAIAELQRAGGGGKPTVGHGHIFRGQGRPPDIRRPKDDGVVASLDGGVGHAHVLAAVRIEAIGPDAFLGARIDVDAIDDKPFARVRVDGPAARSDELEACDADILAAEQQNQARIHGLCGISSGKRSEERFASGLHLELIGTNVEVIKVVGLPLVGGLSVNRAAAFEGDIVQVLADEERGFRRRIELAAFERSKEGCAGLEIEAHAGAEMELAGGVLARRKIDGSTTGFPASIDSLLQSGTRVVLFAAGGAVALHVIDKLGRKLRSG